MRYVSINGNTAVVKVTGNFTNIVCLSLREELSNALSSGCTKVEVDFKETTFIDSASIGELNKVRRRVGKENLKARNLSGQVYTMFRTSTMLDWVEK